MPTPISKLFLPRRALAGCVFAAIYRDTRGVPLSEGDRINHFPASPLVTATYVFHGALTILEQSSDPEYALQGKKTPACFAMGPTATPVSSFSRGEVAAISVGFYHDAWLRLGGDPEFRQVPRCLKEAFTGFAQASSPDQGWSVFCAQLASAWEEQRPKGWRSVWGISDWCHATLTRAALAEAGQSIRSFERRLKRTSGQTRRSLDFYSAFENLHRVVSQKPGTPLAEVALTAGYCDQSHMGGVVRRATGFTPARLNKAIRTEESFWCYRLLGERF